jgi:hypothetical protein
MYSITENIYCSQLSSVAILLQPEPVSHRIMQGNDCFLSLCAIVFRSPPASHVSSSNVSEAHSYFASAVLLALSGLTVCPANDSGFVFQGAFTMYLCFELNRHT